MSPQESWVTQYNCTITSAQGGSICELRGHCLNRTTPNQEVVYARTGQQTKAEAQQNIAGLTSCDHPEMRQALTDARTALQALP